MNGPIVKDAMYYAFWVGALLTGAVLLGTMNYLLWQILLMLREMIVILKEWRVP